MWVDYRGSLSIVYNDGEISTCGWIIEVHSVQSTMMEAHACTHRGVWLLGSTHSFEVKWFVILSPNGMRTGQGPCFVSFSLTVHGKTIQLHLNKHSTVS